MRPAINHQNSAVPKVEKYIYTITNKVTSSNRKSKLIDNKDLYDDTDDPGYSDSSLPEIGKEKQKRMTKTRKLEPVLKNAVDPRQLQLPRLNSNPSLVGSEKKDSATEKVQDEADTHHLDYSDYPILKKIQENVIGRDLVINTPYGNRNVVYCDFTASGRSLSFIENYIQKHVYPTYANTHSTTGHNARQTGKFREEARAIVKHCVNASKDDVIIFTGSGTTSGMHKLAWALRINQPNVAKETVVMIGPYEHHSNILPWREYGTKLIRLKDNPETGLVDLIHLQEELKMWKEKRRHILVCISAASNVTGIITDVDAVSSIAHKYGAFVAFDYAAGGPYLKIDMNPNKTAYKDAVILSPHKFVGGPGTPGILIAKKWIFRNSVPDKVGGGTVRYVTRETHGYVSNIEEREEGGTPAIVESIRAGLVFKLKQDVGEDVIQTREEELCSRAFSVWEKNPTIFVLGNHTAERVPIFSFVTMHPDTGKLVHHNFISTLLSDLFGIQARGGCACAGPYSEDLLGITEPVARKFFTSFLVDKTTSSDKNAPSVMMEVMKPGFTRINLSYFYDDEMTNFIIAAVDVVTKHGWKLLPQYTFDIRTGSWTHKNFTNQETSHLKTLEDIDIFKDTESRMSRRLDDNAGPSFDEALAESQWLFREAEESARMTRISSASLTLRDMLPRDKRKLRWFLTPIEAMNIMADRNESYLDQNLFRLPFKLVQPVQRTVQDRNSDYCSSRSLSSSRTEKSSSLTSRSDAGSKENLFERRYQGNLQNSETSYHGFLSDRSGGHNRKNQAPRDGSQTERSEKVVHSERSRSLQQRDRSERSNNGVARRRDRSLSKIRSERWSIKDKFQQENMKRKLANGKNTDIET